MKTIYEHIGYNNKGWRIKLLSRKEAYKGIDRIRLEFLDIPRKKKVWYDLQLFEAASIASGLSEAILQQEAERLERRRKARKAVK
jgi:hypothetical protein